MTQREPQFHTHNVAFIEGLYEDYLRDPRAVDPAWREYFAQLSGNGHLGGARVGPSFTPSSIFAPVARGGRATNGDAAARHDLKFADMQDRVDQFIRAYRRRGHTVAAVNPLGPRRPTPAELQPMFYGFTDADLERTFSTKTIQGADVLTLREIIDRMQTTYCRSIGVQFMHIDDQIAREWLQVRMEGSHNRLRLTRSEQLRILIRLSDAVVFEEFVQKKYVGAKSFSLEGAESLIPLLDLAIEKAGEQGIEEIVFAMAHRGRLNVLVNILGKSPQEVFREFEDIDPEIHRGRGDVKYHLGFSNEWKTSNGHKVHLALCFNPSHLEFVNPVALGRLRAKQDFSGDAQRKRGVVFMIHGDAAFVGEGITQETFNLSQLRAYETGGAVHVIVNNQIGFTTTTEQGCSGTYPSDVAKMLRIPIFHVNGEDPEAVAQVVRLALDFRAAFRRDVVINMYCYRRRGHNETDEPSFTHPLLYRAIRERKSVREGYLEHLLALGGTTREQADFIADQLRENLEHGLSVARAKDYAPKPEVYTGVWFGYYGGLAAKADHPKTAVDALQLSDMLQRLTKLPADFKLHPKLERTMEARRAMAKGEQPLDWAAAEALALGTLALQRLRVRMTGQDCERGTFSHRHAVLHDYDNGNKHMPLQHLSPDQAPVEIHNSCLSEAAVMGFEYGYSLDCPRGLVIWEAQFGDFCNAAQVIIDQFLVSAEEKWRRLSGLVLLLPHGFEGSGPEHSSARLERFLAQGARDNIQVVNLTTPAQIFHVLRRQALRRWRKPLIVMSPKSLLRHPQVVSAMDELALGRFHSVLADSTVDPARVRRVLLCSGKIYYELDQRRRDLAVTDIAIVRIEEIYPLPRAELTQALEVYPENTPCMWVQEEPENMGAWNFLRIQFGQRLLERFPFSGIHREAAASPATGSNSSHKLEQAELLTAAFAS